MNEEQQKENSKKFEEGIINLQKEFGMTIYPANAVMEGGEVVPVIKFRFIEHTVTPEEIKLNNLEGEVLEGEVIEIPVETK